MTSDTTWWRRGTHGSPKRCPRPPTRQSGGISQGLPRPSLVTQREARPWGAGIDGAGAGTSPGWVKHEVGRQRGRGAGASPAQASGGSSLCSISLCSGTQGPSPRSPRGCTSLLETPPSARGHSVAGAGAGAAPARPSPSPRPGGEAPEIQRDPHPVTGFWGMRARSGSPGHAIPSPSAERGFPPKRDAPELHQRSLDHPRPRPYGKTQPPPGEKGQKGGFWVFFFTQGDQRLVVLLHQVVVQLLLPLLQILPLLCREVDGDVNERHRHLQGHVPGSSGGEPRVPPRPTRSPPIPRQPSLPWGPRPGGRGAGAAPRSSCS